MDGYVFRCRAVREAGGCGGGWKWSGQADRPLVPLRLNVLPRVHLRPIHRVIYPGPDREVSSWGGLPA